jgi:uncharacterized protein with beta-barrel porin domain
MPRRAALLGLVGAWTIVGASARATDFPVTTNSDTGSGSLRQAVSDANAGAAGSDSITFSLSSAGQTIQLTSDLEAVKSQTLAFVDTTNAVTIDANDKVLFQNADTAHAFNFSNLVTYRDGKMLFTEATAGIVAGVLNGDDVQLTKAGAGTLTLNAGSTIALATATSSVTIDGGTLVVNGTLTDAGALSVAGPATLLVNSGGSVSAKDVTATGTIDVDGSLTATNSLLVASGGNLLVAGTVNAPAKTITNHGTIDASGTITAGSLVIASDGLLTGNAGTVNAPMTVSGRVAPATTLNATGPVTFASGSTYEVDMSPSASDLLAVTNTVTIQPGARLAINADPNAFALATPSTKTVLTGSSITGQFTPTDYAFFDEIYNYQPGSLMVTLTKNSQSFTPFGQTPNQAAVAQALDAASAAPSADLQTVLTSLYSAQANEISPLLDAIGGESLTAFATARQILAERTSRALHRRARDPAWGSGCAFYQSERCESETVDPDEAPLRGGAWFDALGLYGDLDGKSGEADVNTKLYGGTLGGDVWIERFVVGLAAGYARSDVDLDGRHADAFGDTAQGALYAGYVDPRGYVSAYGRYAYTFEDSLRKIESSTLSRRAHARFDAQDYGAGGELGLTVLSFGGVALQPIAGVDWLRLTEERYTEHGAGDLNLVVHPDDLESTTTRFGGRVFGRLEMERVGTFVPELRAFYQHLYGDRERALDARLSGTPGLGSIGVRGASLPREALILGLGWGVSVGENLTVSFDYDAVLDSDRVEHQGTVAARVAF